MPSKFFFRSPLAIVTILGLAPLAFAQNPRSVLSSHPRMMINDTIADTWQPNLSRLAAISQRALSGGSPQAITDFTTLRAGITSTLPLFGNSSNEDANLNLLLNYALTYQIYHKAKQDTVANPYAAAAWAGMSGMNQAVYYIKSIVTDSQGVATVTLSAPANPPIQLGGYALGIWGVSNDFMNGPITVTAVTSPTTFTYPSAVPNATFTNSGMLGSTTWLGAAVQGESARQLSQWAYFYDWCYDWLVANGHDQYARDQIKAGYWSNTLTRGSSQWSDQVREADFHNYTSISETAVLEAGLALFGDDPLAPAILNEGVGYLWEGVNVQPAQCCSDTYEFNVKKSTDALTGGAMNWEGPTYWRAGTIRFLRALEAFDSATGRQNNIWVTQFPNAKNAGMYKVYLRDPSGQMANFGDGGNENSFAGRDNFGMSILNDRFPDPHFVWMMTNSPNDWNSGDSGETGLVYKLIYFPYVNGPGTHDPSDLPLGAQFGADVIMRTGWGPNDTFITYTGSIKGTYHRHDDAGTFTIFSNGSSLVLGQPYTLADPTYNNYNRRTIGANTLTIYDPTDCWKDTAATCGIDAYGGKIVNDGGQLRTLRRYYNQFNSDEFQLSRIWSGSLFTDGRYSTVYSVIDAASQPTFLLGTGYEHVTQDLTSSYVNSFSGSTDDPHVKVAPVGGVTRELVHFQPTSGSTGSLVIFDQITATDPNFKKSWLLHTVNAPKVNGVPSSPGDTTYPGGSMTQFDNLNGRVFVSHVLPSAANVRTVGGNACPVIPIQGATNANPAVFYAPAHGLQPGEAVGLATGVQPDSGGPVFWPNWLIDLYFGYYTVASVPDADHFTISSGYGSNSSGWLPWTTAFTSGVGAPTAPGAFGGQVYYQTDATNGATVWQWSGNAWVNLVAAGYGSPTGYKSPVVYTHANCNWAYYVDQFGPPGSPGAHLWNGSMDGTVSQRPAWLVSVSPPTGNLTDYFLNVLSPTSTSVNTPPTTTLVTDAAPSIRTGSPVSPEASGRKSNSVYGVQIVDGGGVFVAVFSTLPGGASTLAYSTQHAGIAMHVACDLTKGKYVVIQNGNAIGTFYAGDDGSISFHETGGGEFRIIPADEAISTDSGNGNLR